MQTATLLPFTQTQDTHLQQFVQRQFETEHVTGTQPQLVLTMVTVTTANIRSRHLSLAHGISVCLQSCIIIITPCSGDPDHMKLVARLADPAQVFPCYIVSTADVTS